MRSCLACGLPGAALAGTALLRAIEGKHAYAWRKQCVGLAAANRTALILLWPVLNRHQHLVALWSSNMHANERPDRMIAYCCAVLAFSLKQSCLNCSSLRTAHFSTRSKGSHNMCGLAHGLACLLPWAAPAHVLHPHDLLCYGLLLA